MKIILAKFYNIMEKYSKDIKHRYSRYGYYFKIENFLNTLALKPGKCLLIGDTKSGEGSTKDIITSMLPCGTTVLAPDYPEVDIQKMPYDDDSFDYVIADLVLEHVRNPWLGVEEVRRVLKPGGITILTSALMVPIHGEPHDYWRFTFYGMEVLCENFSEILCCDGTGSRGLLRELWINAKQRHTIEPNTKIARTATKYNKSQGFLIMVFIIAKK